MQTVTETMEAPQPGGGPPGGNSYPERSRPGRRRNASVTCDSSPTRSGAT